MIQIADYFEIGLKIIIIISVICVFISIFIDFELFQEKERIKHEKRSIVATGSMIGFFILIYLLIRFQVGEITLLKGQIISHIPHP